MKKEKKIFWNPLGPDKMLSSSIPVLLIDDNPIDNLINKRTLEFYGAFNITVFHSAKEALEHLIQTKVKYQHIFVDLIMPVMDGFAFIQQFIELDLQQKQGQLLILSVSINPSDYQKAAGLGIKFIEKPLTIEKLKIILIH